MISIGYSGSPVTAANRLASVDLPPPALPNTATFLMARILPFKRQKNLLQKANPCYKGCTLRIDLKDNSGLRTPTPRAAPRHDSEQAGADDRFEQTYHTDNGRRSDGDGRGAARLCPAERARRSCR